LLRGRRAELSGGHERLFCSRAPAQHARILSSSPYMHQQASYVARRSFRSAHAKTERAPQPEQQLDKQARGLVSALWQLLTFGKLAFRTLDPSAGRGPISA
jgi:hypothetical protein